jgi:hypothetical protein
VQTRQLVQLVLAVALVAAALRLGIIYYQRHSATPAPAAQQPAALDPDYYVVPKKLHAYDVKSLRAALAGHSAWVRQGYSFAYYPYDRHDHHVDFAHQAGLLLPLEHLDIQDVIPTPPPAADDPPQIVAIFARDGRDFAVPVGAHRGDDYTIYADDMLFYEDPHQLYGHWPPQVWQAIDRRQVLPGMNELQASFALGMGVPQSAGGAADRTVVYPDNGHPTTVVFRGGRATEIRAGSAASPH